MRLHRGGQNFFLRVLREGQKKLTTELQIYSPLSVKTIASLSYVCVIQGLNKVYGIQLSTVYFFSVNRHILDLEKLQCFHNKTRKATVVSII